MQVGAYGRDDNDSAITTLGLQQSKSITFVAASTGAVGPTTLFTVTGTVAVKVFGFCTSNLTGSGTVEVGVSGSTASLCDQVNATDIDNHEVYQGSVLAIAGSLSDWKVVNQDIIQTIATNTVTGGVLTYYCEYVPLSQGARVIAA